MIESKPKATAPAAHTTQSSAFSRSFSVNLRLKRLTEISGLDATTVQAAFSSHSALKVAPDGKRSTAEAAETKKDPSETQIAIVDLNLAVNHITRIEGLADVGPSLTSLDLSRNLLSTLERSSQAPNLTV